MTKTYFAYILTDPRQSPDVPIYVGKGSGDRVLHHFSGRKNRNAFLVAKIKAIESAGFRVGVTIIDAESEADAFAIEARLIGEIGRKDLGTGPLCNFTNGGDGPSGLVHSAETRALMSKASSGRKQSREVVENRTAQLVGRKNSAEQKARMSEAAKRRYQDPEQRRLITERLQAMARNPITLAKMSASKKGIPLPQATREKGTAASVARRMMLAGTGALNHSEEGKANMRAAKLRTKENRSNLTRIQP